MTTQLQKNQQDFVILYNEHIEITQQLSCAVKYNIPRFNMMCHDLACSAYNMCHHRSIIRRLQADARSEQTQHRGLSVE